MTTYIRFCYDATIAVALACVFALVVALVAAVIVGGNAPNLAFAIVVFLLVLAIQGFRSQRGWDRSASKRVALISGVDEVRPAGTYAVETIDIALEDLSFLMSSKEKRMTDVRDGSLGARVHKVRCDAANREILVRKSRGDLGIQRYIMIDRAPRTIKQSHNFQFPYSFSLEEAEAYFAERL